jgi:hypothetical protein
VNHRGPESVCQACRVDLRVWSIATQRWVCHVVECSLYGQDQEGVPVVRLGGGGSWLYFNVNRKVTRASGRKKKK